MTEANQDLKEIRRMMEQSTRFISLSGLSGILAGAYALAGGWAAQTYFLPAGDTRRTIFLALLVLVLALVTAAMMSRRRARRLGEKVLNKAVLRLLVNLGIPLFTGGLFCLLLLYRSQTDLLAGIMLIFYGLALINAAKFTANYIHFLGLLQVLTGLLAVALPEYGLQLWTIGFGWLHIVYGAYVHWRYER